ncbi:MAG: S8 family serine peptidase [Meiothermus sp.]|nr:S8 family serine peptidase [Meiothermus sp.]
MRLRYIKQALALSLIAVVAACGGTPPQATSPGGSGYLLTVRLEPADTRETVAQRYGGEVIAWLDDQAILRMGEEAVAQLQARGVSMQNTTLEANADVGTPATMSGWNAWGSGWNAWGSGWNAWGSGWNAWASGSSSIPVIPPSNRPAFLQIKLPQAHALARDYGSGIKVAVIDTGLDLAHPMFTGRLAPSSQWKDYVDGDSNPQDVPGDKGYGHGTAVAGLILQVAPRATILPIRVLGSDGSGNVDNVVAAIDWARQQGAQIINLSLGTDVNVSALRTQISYVNGLGVYVVAAAGNRGGSLDFPAANATNSDRLISVGSVDGNGNRSSFSNSGTALEFMAPGENIVTAYPESRVATVRGTSFAAPLVSGILALAMSETSSLSWSSLSTWLSTSTFGAGTTNSRFGLINTVSFAQRLPGIQLENALFVHGGASPNANDDLLISRLQSLGYSVTPREDKKARTADATGRDLVLISATASGGDVNTKFAAVAVPVVVWRADVFDEMGLTAAGQSGTTDKLTQVSLVNGTHPLAAGLSAPSNPAVYTAGEWFSWGVPGSGAVVVGRMANNAAQANLFAYDTGAQMVGRTAPARRVAFFMRDNQASKLTPVGWNLFEAAVTWAVSGN